MDFLSIDAVQMFTVQIQKHEIQDLRISNLFDSFRSNKCPRDIYRKNISDICEDEEIGCPYHLPTVWYSAKQEVAPTTCALCNLLCFGFLYFFPPFFGHTNMLYSRAPA